MASDQGGAGEDGFDDVGVFKMQDDGDKDWLEEEGAGADDEEAEFYYDEGEQDDDEDNQVRDVEEEEEEEVRVAPVPVHTRRHVAHEVSDRRRTRRRPKADSESDLSEHNLDDM